MPVVTDHGRQVAALPLDPVFAHFILRAAPLNCMSEALTAVSMLSAENVLYMPAHTSGAADAAERREKAILAHRSLAAYEGDVTTLIGVYERWLRAGGKGGGERHRWCSEHFVNSRSMDRAHDVRNQLVTIVRRLGLDPMVSCGNGKSTR